MGLLPTDRICSQISPVSKNVDSGRATSAVSFALVNAGPAGVPQEPPSVRVAVGASFELLAALWAFLDDERHPVYEASSDLVRTEERRLGTDAVAIRRFAGGSLRFWDHVIGLALEAGEPYGVTGLLALIEAMDPSELRLHLAGRYNYHVGRVASAELIEKAVDGDATAQRAFRRAAFPDEPSWQRALRHVLRTDAEQLRAELLHIIQLWRGRAYGEDEERLMGILEREGVATRRQAVRLGPIELIDRVTDGLRWAIDTSMRDVLLAPSYAARPVVFYVEHRGTTLILFPVSEESVRGDEFGPPGRLVKLVKALADEGRLKVLYALRERELTVAEIAELMGMPRTSLWHHILILRSAGLIRATKGAGNQMTYQLQEDALPQVSELLEGFLAGEPAARLAKPLRRR
jgi:DNA-binding transcriptional ArsR family regulator